MRSCHPRPNVMHHLEIQTSMEPVHKGVAVNVHCCSDLVQKELFLVCVGVCWHWEMSKHDLDENNGCHYIIGEEVQQHHISGRQE